MRFVLGRMRQLFMAVPLTFRPLLFLIGPLLLFHGFFGRVPEFAFRPLPPPPPLPAEVKKVDAPSPAIAASLIEQSAQFKEPRVLTCPRVIDADSREMEKYPLYAILSEQRLAVIQDTGSTIRRQYSVDLTPEAKSEMFADVTEDLFNITVITGRRKMGNVANFEGPPHAALQPPLRYATIGYFTWSWEASNRIGRLTDGWNRSGPYRGVAYFLREPSGTWVLHDVQMTETR